MKIPLFTGAFLGSLVALLSFTPIANATLYAPGETLDPSCAPTDIDCGVESVVGDGTTGQVPYYAADGNIVSATSTIFLSHGNVGLGTTDPQSMLSIMNAATPTSFLTIGNSPTARYVEINDHTQSFGDIDGGTGALFTINHPANKFTFENGNVGIGTTTPTAQLDILNSTFTNASELITNGTFTGNANGWVLLDDSSYGDNNVIDHYNGGSPWIETDFTSVAGATYALTFTISDANAPMYWYLIQDGLDYPGLIAVYPGTHTYIFTTDFTGTETIGFDDWNYNVGDTWTLDNVSIKRIQNPKPTLNIRDISGATILSLGGDYRFNTALGSSALTLNISGTANTAFGYHALSSATSSNNNAAFGAYASESLTSGTGNTSFGAYALNANSTVNGLTAFGNHALAAAAGANNTAVGNLALSYNFDGTDNTALGYLALASSTGNYNVAVGSYALRGDIRYGTASGDGNTAVGYYSLASSTASVDSNTALGEFTLPNLISGGSNVALGADAMYSAENISDAVAIGPFALYSATTSQFGTVAIGYQAMANATSSGSGIAIGWQALYSGGGVDNIGVGSGTNYWNLTGERNTMIGNGAMFHNRAGSRNVAIGEGAFGASGEGSVGNDNVIIGAWTGYTLTGGSGNTIIGANIASTSGGSYTNTIILGDGVGHQRILVNSAGNTGIASTSPWRTLSVNGTVAFNGLTGAIGNGSICLKSTTKELVYNSGSDNCLSSLRSTKHDIVDLSVSGESLIQNLKPVSFIYNDDASSTVRYGFIAEDTAGVDSHLGTYDAAGNLSGVDDRAVLSIVVKAVKEMLNTLSGFAQSFTSQNITASQKLCIGSTCVTESELQTLLQQSNQTPSSPTPTDSTDNTATTTPSDDSTASTTPPTDSSPDTSTATSSDNGTDESVTNDVTVPPTPSGDGSASTETSSTTPAS